MHREILTDIKTECAVIGSIIKGGANSFLDISSMLSMNTFSDIKCSAIFKAIKSCVDDDQNVLDLATLTAKLSGLRLSNIVDTNFLSSIQNKACDPSNLAKLCAKLKKLEIGRILFEKIKESEEYIENISGEESINEILAKVQIDYNDLFKVENEPKHISDSLSERIEELMANPVEQVGISTGFPIYDAAIGGGLRGGTVNVIGARIKIGKSCFLNEVALHLASNGIKVLFVDTEMRIEEQQNRCLANLSSIGLERLETGKFADNPSDVT